MLKVLAIYAINVHWLLFDTCVEFFNRKGHKILSLKRHWQWEISTGSSLKGTSLKARSRSTNRSFYEGLFKYTVCVVCTKGITFFSTLPYYLHVVQYRIHNFLSLNTHVCWLINTEMYQQIFRWLFVFDDLYAEPYTWRPTCRPTCTLLRRTSICCPRWYNTLHCNSHCSFCLS